MQIILMHVGVLHSGLAVVLMTAHPSLFQDQQLCHVPHGVAPVSPLKQLASLSAVAGLLRLHLVLR